MARKRRRQSARQPRHTARPAPRVEAYPVWDAPTRLSHWAITVLFVFQFATGQFPLLPDAIHLWTGQLLLAVVLFRIQWGLAGGTSARFRTFLAGPRAVVSYLPRLFSGRPTRWPGHNPLGAISVVLLLGLLLAQCLTGLFVESWAEIRGPLAERVSRDTAILMTDLHGLIRWPLLILVVVHVSASLYYRAAKKEDRITAIFGHGRLELERDPGYRSAPPARAWTLLAISLATVALIAWLGPIN